VVSMIVVMMLVDYTNRDISQEHDASQPAAPLAGQASAGAMPR
jgi:hypothetical protein